MHTYSVNVNIGDEYFEEYEYAKDAKTATGIVAARLCKEYGVDWYDLYAECENYCTGGMVSAYGVRYSRF